MISERPAYAAEDFGHPTRECDLVMKGGVTSGLVYPYAILELAKVYRFRSIGGTSAGGIASAFAAAAEYARSVRGDPEAFLRLQKRCDELPGRLLTLFQPTPRYAGLMRFLLRAQSWTFPFAWAVALVLTFWLTSLLGAALGAALMALLSAGWSGALLGGAVGLIAFLIIRLWRLAGGLGEQGFGLCPGLTQPGHREPGLVDWLHASLQDIAFGDPAHPEPLTFGHLAEVGADGKSISLKMITTNLSMRRPHALPDLKLQAGFSIEEWRRYFPSSVVDHLARVTRPLRRAERYQQFPQAGDLPVLVAVRMSLSFPVLFSAVPLYARDFGGYRLALRTSGHPSLVARRMWFTDGGLSSNFPIHLFDSVLPTRPTFALSLDDLPPGSDPAGDRVSIPRSAGDGVGLPIHETVGLTGFLNALLGAAKDWNDNLLAGMPGQRERIARVLLSRDEGGLNLTMPPEVSQALMGYGRTVGRRFVEGAFDFDEHRWRRALVAYEQLEKTLIGMDHVWSNEGFEDWYKAYAKDATSYPGVTKTDRDRIRRRLAAFAGLSEQFRPVIAAKDRKMPRPEARLRIGPNV